MFYTQRPSLSGSAGRRVRRHDGFVGIALAGRVASGFVGLYVGPGAALLMIGFAVITRQTGVPARHVIPTREAVVVVVEPLVGIGRIKTVVCRCWGGWNASCGRGSCSRWCGSVVRIVTSSSTSTIIVASAAVVTKIRVRRILLRRGWWNVGCGGRCGGRSDG